VPVSGVQVWTLDLATRWMLLSPLSSLSCGFLRDSYVAAQSDVINLAESSREAEKLPRKPEIKYTLRGPARSPLPAPGVRESGMVSQG
jgi:hypothetical protein